MTEQESEVPDKREREWYVTYQCGHAHCPRCECEKPQPRMKDGKMICGRCYVLDGVQVEVLPCVPGVCD